MMDESEALVRMLMTTEKNVGALNRYYDERSRELSEQVSLLLDSVTRNVKVAIVTALPHERAAVEAALGVGERVDVLPKLKGSLNLAIHKVTNSNNRTFDVVVTQTLNMGNNAAAIAATALLHRFQNIGKLIMVGIAGGIPTYIHGRLPAPSHKEIEEHVRLGDVVVSSKGILQYDFKTLDLRGGELRVDPHMAGAAFREAVHLADENLRCGEDAHFKRWLNNICEDRGVCRPSEDTDRCFVWYKKHATGKVVKSRKPMVHPVGQPGRHNGIPKVHHSLIGSANILMKNPFERDSLRKAHGIRAIEMEGSGIADASWSFGVQHLVIRGVCDYCDMDKKNQWQEFAAASAAAYARTLLHFMDP